MQWHKAHSGMITSEETFWAPKHINRFFLMKSQHCPKDVSFRFIVTLRNDIPIFVVYTMMRKSFSFCYFFRFKIWVTMYIHVWRKFIRRGQSSTQWFSPGRGGGWGRGSVKVCRKGGRCPQARIVNSLHCFCKKLFKKKKTVLVSWKMYRWLRLNVCFIK